MIYFIDLELISKWNGKQYILYFHSEDSTIVSVSNLSFSFSLSVDCLHSSPSALPRRHNYNCHIYIHTPFRHLTSPGLTSPISPPPISLSFIVFTFSFQPPSPSSPSLHLSHNYNSHHYHYPITITTFNILLYLCLLLLSIRYE